ncbi:MAG: hypothetical protein HY907_02460 [Deltaproteobacteria bacterium]|nr:hypothetical protein [Deltaproteobacteria bacterium]
MLPYLELHIQSLVLLFGYGLLGFFALALAHSGRDLVVGRPREPEATAVEEHDGIREHHGRVPLFLVLLYVGLAVWAVLYVLAHACWGMDFGG